MKKIIAIFVGFVIISGCNNQNVEKPEKLLDENQMADIIYDLSVLEAMRSKNPLKENIKPNDYILRKYHVDSLQFAQNNRYYAYDVATYKKIYEKVNDRLTLEKRQADSIVAKNSGKPEPATSDTPQVQ